MRRNSELDHKGSHILNSNINLAVRYNNLCSCDRAVLVDLIYGSGLSVILIADTYGVLEGTKAIPDRLSSLVHAKLVGAEGLSGAGAAFSEAVTSVVFADGLDAAITVVPNTIVAVRTAARAAVNFLFIVLTPFLIIHVVYQKSLRTLILNL